MRSNVEFSKRRNLLMMRDYVVFALVGRLPVPRRWSRLAVGLPVVQCLETAQNGGRVVASTLANFIQCRDRRESDYRAPAAVTVVTRVPQGWKSEVFGIRKDAG